MTMQYNGYEIARSSNSGGKAGSGHNKTATIQVRKVFGSGGYLILKHFRFTTGTLESKREAEQKAKSFIDKLEKSAL